LEIKGFKSFADRTHVMLDNPITGIVGPNGCGKSNIVDAIRWVIGEHKIKSLRSDNLDDLVFNGSRTRAGSGMAEVSLTFENTRNLLPTEFTTVTISRKFYKSGESEYRLNDVTCRLKDIHNLFLDTGVSNDSYAIIELGMVDDIIKDKDGARRRMLEQAAGISIYKTRKKEAKQKLEGTEGDLARIEDLLFEIGNNLRTLESQAKKAERYLQIKGEYKEISVELAKASLEHFNEQYKSLNEQSTRETDRKTELEAAVATGEAAVEADKVKLIEREQELNGLQRAFNDLVARIRQLESDKRLAAQRLEHLKERERSLSQFLSGAGQQLTQLEESIHTAGTRIEEEVVSLQELRDSLDSLRTSMDEKRKTFDEKKGVVERLRTEYSTTQRGGFEAEKKLAVAEAQISNLQRSAAQIREEGEQRTAQIGRLHGERDAAVAQLTGKQGELEELQARQEAVKSKILQGQEELEQYRAKLVDENRALDARRNEHDLLKSLVDSLEGYPDSIKFLKKNRDWGSNAPLLSDVFVVKPEYRTAIESVLEPYLNYYVVENIGEAAQAVRLLEGAKKGKGSFFLLDKVDGTAASSVNGAAALADGQVRALDAVEVDGKYATLANRLLGNVVICEGLSETTLSDGHILVDKTGRFRSEPLSVSGGSVGLFEGNKIGRAKNLERLAAEVAARTQTSATLRAQISEVQTRITGFNAELSDRAIQSTQQDINRLQSTISNTASRAEHLEQLAQSGTKRLEDINAQITASQESTAGARAEGEKLAAQLRELEDKGKEAAEAFSIVEAEYNKASAEYNAHNIRLHQQQSKLEGLKQELEFRKSQLETLRKQIATSDAERAQAAAGIAETETTLHAGDEELYQLLSKKETDERTLSEKDRQYYEMRNALSAAESTLSGKRREKEAAETILNAVREKLSEMKLRLAGMKERLQVEFRVDLDAILEDARTTTLSLDELQAETDRLKRRLETLGEINPTAIEAFTEMKARHDFIAEQKADLVAAKDSLLATIEEVEGTANAKFRATFDAVRENFLQVFKALFTEADTADLRLTDENNLADSGIEIYAQPKGKKPSTLTQLSGGEKTLTSTAFLFAIYLIKPAPFCILDEVDAPLDDANVGKFTNMIRKFSDNSQFIIVTHNKQTMAAVDVIYGVTMQEPGVSKLVPVDFRSLN
jgi:chromosome segregation protein